MLRKHTPFVDLDIIEGAAAAHAAFPPQLVTANVEVLFANQECHTNAIPSKLEESSVPHSCIMTNGPHDLVPPWFVEERRNSSTKLSQGLTMVWFRKTHFTETGLPVLNRLRRMDYAVGPV